MQQVPNRRGRTELLSFDPVEQVVASNQSKPNCGNCPSRQVDERRECNHRRANCEDHLHDKVVDYKTEGPTKANDSELDENQPAAAREQVPANLTGLAPRAVQKRRDAGEKDECRGAEMRNPAREE